MGCCTASSERWQGFRPSTATWFREAFDGPTPIQTAAWPVLGSGDHALLVAPTGSGKTLAAFLAAIDHTLHRPQDASHGVRVLYVSPLKALAVDVERNLRAPLIGIGRVAARDGAAIAPARVHVRTGDTPARDRARQTRRPAEIVVTTPESLYLLLTSQARETLRTVQTVILDEIHTMVGTRRGVHLAVSLERLAALADRDPQRVGLSATVRPSEVAARFLGGDRPVRVLDTSEPPRLDLRVMVPVPDMEAPPPAPAVAPAWDADPEAAWREDAGLDDPWGDRAPGVAGPSRPTADVGPTGTLSAGLWPAIVPRLLAAIREHQSTILFVNSRILCERLAAALNELAGASLVRAHHGSLSHARRAEVEDALKAGRLPAIVATSSLELGIDMGAVDLVICVESPATVASGLQRVGRAGHQVGAASEGWIVPKYRGDLLEAAVVSRGMVAGAIEPVRMPERCLDVLAQQVVAVVAEGPVPADDLWAQIRRAAPYADLSRSLYDAVLDMLSGRYPSTDFADLAPRIAWDRTTDVLSPRRGTRQVAILNGGTIPDRGLYRVHLAPEGPRLGELDEEMVYESREGDVLVLGATSWRIEEITTDRVLVSPAPGQAGRMPFWRGERPGRPLALGRAMGGFLREMTQAKQPDAWLATEAPSLDEHARTNLIAYVAAQREATGVVPSDTCVVVERFRDELGDWRVCLLTPYGDRVHAPWALAIEAVLSEQAGWDVQVFHSDDGIALRLVDAEDLPALDALFPDPEAVEALLIERLRTSPLFAARFREAAGRALLLPRRSAKGRTPLWLQRKKASDLLAVASRHPTFPIVLETYRECLQDVFDLPALDEVLRGIRSRAVQVHEVETPRASPFARGLVFRFVAEYLYDGDAPLAERRAQALSLDRDLLRELLGGEGLRDLLDPSAIDAVHAALQHLDGARPLRDADDVHDLLRRLGDLDEDEIGLRGGPEGPDHATIAQWLATLESQRRVAAVRIAGVVRWIAAEDAARYRDALGVTPPPGLPAALLQPATAPLEALVTRWARTHTPFQAHAPASRWGVDPDAVLAVLASLEQADRLVHAALRPGGQGLDWCDPDVLRRLRRRSLAILRAEIEPVDPDAFARFLPAWHGIGAARRGGVDLLRSVVAQLEGFPIPFQALEAEILPARVPGYQPGWLDQLGAMGEVLWVGRGAAGPRDGRIALVRRARAEVLLEPGQDDVPGDAVHMAILDHLRARGASFLAQLLSLPAADGTALASQAIVDGLWDLVWAGSITNDTFQPLRALAAPRRGRRASRHGGLGGGRWSLISDGVGPAADPTARRVAQVHALLERYGVLTREAARAEGIPGGFSALYPVLRELEAVGRIRRGRFVDGLGGAQFALPGAVDRVRAASSDPSRVDHLGAADPANPWGSLLPWPSPVQVGGRPQRVSGAHLVQVDGVPVLWIGRSGRTIVTFRRGIELPGALERAVEVLRSQRGARIRTIDTVDGAPPDRHPAQDAFLRAGVRRDPAGWVLDPVSGS